MNDTAPFRRLLRLLSEKGLTLAAAESCTGGWFSKSMVDLPGASAVFVGGVVSYTNDVKMRLLGVPHELLLQYTAVSASVAEAMAAGVARVTGADIGISVTGLAGPDGGTEEIPVGRVYIGVFRSGRTEAFPLSLDGDRTEIRREATCRMANILVKLLSTEENEI